MNRNQIVEYTFFFGFMGIVAYIVWLMMAPFVSALALSAIIVTICYPLYERISAKMPKQSRTAGALVTTILVLVLIIIPFSFIISSLVNETVAVYSLAENGSVGIEESVAKFEDSLSAYFPGFELNIKEYVRQATSWLAGNVGAIFAGTASTVFSFFISMIGAFYLFKDGKLFTKRLVAISPLPDSEDELILRRLAISVRSVATGTVLIALIQGSLTAIGLTIFGFERAILWGTIAAFGALIPSVGTSIIFIPSVLYLVFQGDYLFAVGLSVWGLLAVGLIDNLLGPYLMSRGNAIHPFLILLSVLGGISLFGPIGFIIGPVVVSLLMVLLELYTTHISSSSAVSDNKQVT